MMPVDLLVRGESVSRETLEKLRILEQLVLKWSPAINLVSKASMSSIWERHVVDSIQVFDLAKDNVEHWCDFGSGGGFPGLVVACMSQQMARPMRVTLVESDARKCVFLREAARQMDLDVNVLTQRIEEMPAAKADIISARALASLNKLCELSAPHLAVGGQCIFPKGAKHLEELHEARNTWDFDLESHQSVTDASAVILVLRNLHRV